MKIARTRIAYRSGYKYQLKDPVSVRIGPRELPCARIEGFINLADGILTIYAGYAWDGPSGLTWDSKTFMPGSLVHDALYQLIREGKLSQNWREYADKVLHQICLASGMNSFRAWYVYHAVRMFGGKATEASSIRPVIYAP